MKWLQRLWIFKIGFGLLIALMITGVPNPNITHAASIANDGIAIKWSEGASLEFSGTPNEVQSGEVTFVVDAGSRRKNLVMKISGTAFSDHNSILDTEYQEASESIWHKAGETFTINVIIGKTVRIRFRASMGGEVTAQKAGRYNAKVSVHVVPIQ